MTNRSEHPNGPVTRGRAVFVPEAIWGRLATIADDRGVSVEDILVGAITDLTAPATVEERIVQLVRSGFTDAAIAGKTGEFVARVRVVRRAAHLPANRFTRGGIHDHERKTA